MFVPSRRRTLARRLPGYLLLPLCLTAACVEESTDPIPGNILVSAKVENAGVPHTMRLTDGQLSIEGDHWDTAITARFDNPHASVTFDLGGDKPIRCVLLQGDNNDQYILSTSSDGKSYQQLWQAGPVDGAGMRTRQGEVSGSSGRYLRVTATGGDNFYSIGEVAAFSECPKGWPKMSLNRIESAPAESEGQAASSWSVSLGVLVAAAAILILLSRKRKPPAPATGPIPGSEPPPPP
jgi:hypothetical protein